MKDTKSGKQFCSFTVAVGRPNSKDADFIQVSAWDRLGQNCAKFLSKGRKVAVVGTVSTHAYLGRNKEPKCQMNVNAEAVEFLSSVVSKTDDYEYGTDEPVPQETVVDPHSGFEEVSLDEDFPF